MKFEPSIRRKNKGFAIVATLVVLAGLVVLAMSMLILVGLERKTARSYSNQYRVELGLDAATNAALASLRPLVERDDFFIVGRDIPENMIEGANGINPGRLNWLTFRDESGWQSIPLFSGEPTQSDPASLPNTPAVSSTLQAIAGNPDNPLLPVPAAGWEELDAATGQTIRYSYWLEDLHGRVDAEMSSQWETQPRVTPEPTQDVPGWFTLFDPENLEPRPDNPVAELTQRMGLLSRLKSFDPVFPQMAGQAGAATERDIAEAYLSLGVPAEVTRFEVVPPLPNVRSPGVPKGDLNQMIANADVEAIARKIHEHLPAFNQRRGGMPNDQNYLNTIAANIIDYADDDNLPTVGPNYRGVDSYPFVNEIYDRYEWLPPSPGNPTQVRIQVRTFVELWNMTNRETYGTVRLDNVNMHRILIPGLGEQTFGEVSYAPQEVTIGPNGFLVLEMAPATGPHVYEFDTGNFPAAPPLRFASSWTTGSTYRLYWGDLLVDTARGGIARTDGTLRPGAGQRKWKGQGSVALDYSIGQMGDPRSSYLIQSWIFPSTYDGNSSWGGRALKRNINNDNFNEVRIPDWPDGGHNSSPGVAAGNDSRFPDALNFPSPEPQFAVSKISNLGFLTSIGELGHIFDPAQWEGVNSNNARPNSNSGGGLTLAIGRPEYLAFERNGRQARLLTDIFSVKTSPVESAKGLINLNTAPREVLRTLWAGMVIDDDPGERRKVIAPFNTQAGDIFADAILAARQERPLLGLSDLLQLSATNGEPLFGDIRLWPSRRPSRDFSDAGREAIFEKLAPLVTFQSRTFRLVVAAEVIAPDGKRLARGKRELSFAMLPHRDEDGGIIANSSENLILFDKRLP